MAGLQNKGALLVGLYIWMLGVSGGSCFCGSEFRLSEYVPVPQINIIRLKPLQTSINRHPDILRIVSDLALSIRAHLHAEFRREKDLFAIAISNKRREKLENK